MMWRLQDRGYPSATVPHENFRSPPVCVKGGGNKRWASCPSLLYQLVSRQPPTSPGCLSHFLLTRGRWRACAGGTASALHLLANLLADRSKTDVTFLAADMDLDMCQAAVEKHAHPTVVLTCMTPEQLRPNVVNTFPMERLAHSVLAWVKVCCKPASPLLDWTLPGAGIM